VRRVDLRRDNARHSPASGKGIPHCIGASMGKLEASQAVEGPVRPRLRLRAGGHCPRAPTSPFADHWSFGLTPPECDR